MLEFLKNYYVLMLVLMVFSYLVPKEEYKAYIHFFIGVFMIVLLLKPVLELFTVQNVENIYGWVEEMEQQMTDLNLEIEEGENIFEYFFFER